MTLIAVIRPDSDNFPLLLHVLGAMVLVGGLGTAVGAQVLGWRSREGTEAAVFGRVAFRALVFVALPAWFLMRIGAEWIYSREGWDEVESEPSWLGIGFMTGDFGGILLLASIVLAGLGARRLMRPGGGVSVLARIATVAAALVLVAYLVAIWAMTAKPT
jgi:hypothetical protein